MKTLRDRFFAKIVTDAPGAGKGGCWLWTAARNSSGMGCLNVDGKTRVAHAFAYEMLIGAIPSRKVLHHTCGNLLCVNPAHLEPITRRESTVRGKSPAAVNAKKTHCKNGHALEGENLYVKDVPRGDLRGKKRLCKTCQREEQRRYRAGRVRKK